MAVAREPWLQKQLLTFFGNAQARRDYRAQLRGNRTLWLWGLYVGFLILVAMTAYSSIADGAGFTVAMAQARLRGLYESVMGMLAFVLVLVTPSLTAGSIVAERERKSLDLVFSAPVEPKYLLVGKMISSYRYIWLLLALALPITALGVAMGGATWQDVLNAMVMLSLASMVITAFGLLMSVLSSTVQGALLGTITLVGGYLLLLNLLSWSFLIPRLMGAGTSPTQEAPFFLAINPFTVTQAAPTHSLLLGVEIPNAWMALIFTLLLTRLVLFGAGSALSPYGSPETRGFRIYGLVFSLLLGVLIGAGFAPVLTPGFVGAGSPLGVGLLVWLLMPALFLAPHLFAHSWDADRKYRNDGLFSWHGIWRGTPSGSLVYAVLIVGLCFGGMGAVGLAIRPGGIPDLLKGATFFLSMWILVWGMGRFASRISTSLRAARSLTTLAMVLVWVLPLPVLTAMQSQAHTSTGNYSSNEIISLSLLWPLFEPAMDSTFAYAALMAILGLGLGLMAERRRDIPTGMAPMGSR